MIIIPVIPATNIIAKVIIAIGKGFNTSFKPSPINFAPFFTPVAIAFPTFFPMFPILEYVVSSVAFGIFNFRNI